MLIVDDEPLVRDVLARVLADHHDVTTADSGLAALDVMSTMTFDVIVCDVMMPGMTGCDLHEKLLRVAPDQARRMIFVTGGATTAEARAFVETVPNPVLGKPFEVEALRELIERQIREHGPAPEERASSREPRTASIHYQTSPNDLAGLDAARRREQG